MLTQRLYRCSLLLCALSSPISVAAATYQIDPTHTYPRFEYRHFGYSTQVQRFDKTSGIITLDSAAKTASVNVTIEAASINTGLASFNDILRGEDFFDTAKYPVITFKSTNVKFEGDKPISIEGQLSIKNITKAVTLTITDFQLLPHPMLKRDAIGANATVKINRSDFGMPKFLPYVSDEINITLPLEAIKIQE